MLQKKTTKYICQIRFRPTLLFFEKIFQISTSLEDEYEHWKASHDPSEVILFDSLKKCLINITPKSLTLVTENDEIGKNVLEEITRLINLFFEETNISVINRVGIRKISIHESTYDYQTFVDSFFEAFYSSRQEMKSISADSVDDVVYVLEGIKNGYKTRVKLGPFKPEQLNMHYENEEFSDQIILNKDTNILTDVDVYTNVESDVDGAIDNLTAMIELCFNIHKESYSLLKDKVCR